MEGAINPLLWMEERMKLLWHSNAPWVPSGYGVQSRIFTNLLKADGHEIVFSAFWGLDGSQLRMNDMLTLPSGYDAYGNDVIQAHYVFHQPDLVISLMDSWVCKPNKWGKLPWLAWTPIDHNPIPTHVINSLKKGNAIPLAMSRFGEKLLRKGGLDPLYCPHAVDPIMFQPRSRKKIRKNFGWEDKFVVGMVAANKDTPSRKGFAYAVEAFAEFRKKHENALLYLHTAKDFPGGEDLELLGAKFELPDDSYFFADPYRMIIGMPNTILRDMYIGMDVLLNPSLGEGFGVPIIEAQAAGTPVIVTNWTSMPELVFAGKTVSGYKSYTKQGSYAMVPDVSEIYDALEEIYSTKDKEALSEKARLGAEEYHPEVVYRNYMLPAIKEAISRTKGRDDLLTADELEY